MTHPAKCAVCGERFKRGERPRVLVLDTRPNTANPFHRECQPIVLVIDLQPRQGATS